MRSRFAIRSIVALVTSLGLVACGGTADDAELSNRSVDESAVDQGQEAEPEENPSDDAGRPADSELVAEDGSWTVLIYLMGDNDLEPYAVGDVFEMAEAGSNENVNIVTLVDRHPGYSDEEIGPLGNFDGTTLVHVGREEIITAFDSGELNLGDPETLKSFLVAGVTEFPADRYALILWDHGGGWTGIGPDDTDGEDILTLP